MLFDWLNFEFGYNLTSLILFGEPKMPQLKDFMKK